MYFKSTNNNITDDKKYNNEIFKLNKLEQIIPWIKDKVMIKKGDL